MAKSHGNDLYDYLEFGYHFSTTVFATPVSSLWHTAVVDGHHAVFATISLDPNIDKLYIYNITHCCDAWIHYSPGSTTAVFYEVVTSCSVADFFVYIVSGFIDLV